MNILTQEVINGIENCIYISNAGLLLTTDETKIITYNKFNSIHNYNKLLQNQFDGMMIAIKIDKLIEFFTQVFDKITVKFILVSSDCDTEIPLGLMSLDNFNIIINDARIIHWFSMNCIESLHPKLSIIPLGINLHSISFQHHHSWLWTNEYLSPKNVEDILIHIKDTSSHFSERSKICYSNFHFTLHSKNGTSDRIDAINKIPKNLIFYEPKEISLKDTWLNQTKYAFVVSPHGNGLDCHRTWEALILGCIVIVKKSPIDSLYDELPVLILNDWSEISEELLNKTIDEYKNKFFNFDKLTTNYWLNKIRSYSLANITSLDSNLS